MNPTKPRHTYAILMRGSSFPRKRHHHGRNEETGNNSSAACVGPMTANNFQVFTEKRCANGKLDLL